MSFAVALKWSFLSELTARVVPPLAFVMLARLLAPEDFGVVAAATMVISFSQVFWDAGMGKAVIQYQGDLAAAADAAFWINCALALVVAATLFAAANLLAAGIFHDERVTAALQVLSLQVLLSAAVSVHTALLQKDLQFKPLFWVRLTTVALPALISVFLAWQGFGYWALIAGTLAGQTAQVVALWRISPWRPRRAFDSHVARELSGFGAWVCLSGLLAWFYVWADSLIVGMFLGSHELGLYRTGNQIAMMVFAIPFGAVTPVLYSHLARMERHKEQLMQSMARVIRLLILVAIPLAFFVFSQAEALEATLFGIQWRGISLVIGVMALMHGFSWVVGMNGEAYRAMGKPSYETIVSATVLVIYLAAYLVSIRHGLEAFVWTRFALALGALLLHLLILRHLMSISLIPITRHLLAVTILAAVMTVPVGLVFDASVMDAWQKLLFGGTLSTAMLASAIYLIWRNGALPEISELMSSSVR